jgi:FMN phosphatase YigB (HAD superfamily)
VTSQSLIFLFDVDNTLLDNDGVVADLRRYLVEHVGQSISDTYWKHVEALRETLGYVDYLGALQRARDEHPHALELLTVSRFLIEYPFVSKLFPQAVDVLDHVRQWGLPVILSDGDVVFQPVKVERAGLSKIVKDHVLIYIHKEKELADVERRYPAAHYVLIDDKLRILDAVKAQWGSRVTTVHVRQGHYNTEKSGSYATPDVSISQIQDILAHGKDSFAKSAG